jgi:hypothetical protein
MKQKGPALPAIGTAHPIPGGRGKTRHILFLKSIRFAHVIDASLLQQLASPTWKNADHCADSLTINFGSLVMLAIMADAFSLLGSRQRACSSSPGVSHSVKATIGKFSRAYRAATPDQQAKLRACMRDIILSGIARGLDWTEFAQAKRKTSRHEPGAFSSFRTQ